MRSYLSSSVSTFLSSVNIKLECSSLFQEALAALGGEDWLTVIYPAMEGWRGDKKKFEL